MGIISDTINRADAIEQIQTWAVNLINPKMLSREDAIYILESMPTAQPEIIDYYYCSNAILKMWMDNIVTDGEYNRIIDKLNAHWGMENE